MLLRARAGDAGRSAQADAFSSLGLVASSTRYTSPLKWMPEWFESDISHVRLVEYPSEQDDGMFRFCRLAPVSSGYRMPLSPAMPQQGMPVWCTSLAHLPASYMKESSMCIFLLLHGTWMATSSRTCENSSRSARKRLMKSTGS